MYTTHVDHESEKNITTTTGMSSNRRQINTRMLVIDTWEDIEASVFLSIEPYTWEMDTFFYWMNNQLEKFSLNPLSQMELENR